MSTHHQHQSRIHDEKGFSLIDVAVVMAIVGILLAGFLATYKMYQATRATTMTEENFMAAQEALGAFVPFKGNRYPRPAPFGLKDGDAGYGEEIAASVVTAPCANAAAAVGKVCRGVGANGKAVLIGTLPFADLNMPDTQARDGYGRLFTYAVTLELTNPNGIDPLDEVNNTTGLAPPDGLPDRDADGDIKYRHYVCVKTQDLEDNGTITPAVDCTKANGNPPRPIALVSHGEDGIGGWLPSGQVYQPCGSVAAASQNENCNFDGTFIQSMRRALNNNGTPAVTTDDFYMRVPVLVRGNNANKNDDTIQVEVREDGNYWGAAGADKIGNKYNYKIGIGVSKPVNPLEVNGNILANQGVLSNDLCADGTTCLETSALAGNESSMDCGDLGMVRDIKNNAVSCVYVAKPDTQCAANEYVVGFQDDGTVVCQALPATCGPAHGRYDTHAPSVSERCSAGTQSGFAGAGPWTWTCTLGAQSVSCATMAAAPPADPPSGCIDECGETRRVGMEWCNRGHPQGKMRCVTDGSSGSYQGCISGLGCCAGGILYCP